MRYFLQRLGQFAHRLLPRHLRRDGAHAHRAERAGRPGSHDARRHRQPAADRRRSRPEYHLDSNYFVQYCYWLKGMLTGDMGYLGQQNLTVANYIKPRILTTSSSASTRSSSALIIAVPLGVFQAYQRDGIVRQGRQLPLVRLRLGPGARARPAAASAAVRRPRSGWFPRIGDKIYPWDDLGEHFKNFFLPTLILTLPLAAVFTRLLRADMVADPAERLHHPGQRQGRAAEARAVGPRPAQLAVLAADQRRPAARRHRRRRRRRRAALRP